MPTVALTPHLHLIIGHNPRFDAIPHGNSLLIQDEVTALIDTTAGPELIPLAETGKVEQLFFTHLHGDHTNFSFLFPAAQIWIPEYGVAARNSMTGFLSYSGFERLGVAAGTYCAREAGYEPGPYNHTYRDGSVLEFGRTRLRAIHAPGHCVDHMLFYHEESGTLLSTDIDLTPFGPHYGNPGSDIDQFEASVRMVRELAPRTVVTSHLATPVTADIPQALDRFIEVVRKRDRRILDALAEPQTLDGLMAAHPIYRAYPHPEIMNRLFEQVMLEKHLDRLLRQGAVVAEGPYYRCCS